MTGPFLIGNCSFIIGHLLRDHAAGAGVVLGVVFASLFPPANFVMEVAAAADGLCLFERLDFGRYPFEDLSFPTHDGDVAKSWRRVDQFWIQPASIPTAAIAESDYVFDRELFVAGNPLDQLAVEVEEWDVVARLFPGRRRRRKR